MVGVAALDNIFVERLWRIVEYEEVYLKGYQTMAEAQTGLKRYFQFYNDERFHQSLGYRERAGRGRRACTRRRRSARAGRRPTSRGFRLGPGRCCLFHGPPSDIRPGFISWRHIRRSSLSEKPVGATRRVALYRDENCNPLN